MLRSAAKNKKYVGVVIDPTDYDLVLDELQKNDGCISEKRRFELAAKAFSHTAAYDTAISNYLSSDQNKDFPWEVFILIRRKIIRDCSVICGGMRKCFRSKFKSSFFRYTSIVFLKFI